ncbi:MAG: MBL fold metallo-hydrolase [Dehalococcoidia bacterium]
METPTLPVAKSWFTKAPLDGGITLLIEPHVDPLFRANIWHVRGQDRDLVVDTGMGIDGLRGALPDVLDKPLVAVATHNHVDHTGGLWEFDERLMHPLDIGLPGFEDVGVNALMPSSYPAEVRDFLLAAGYPMPDLAIDALPYQGYDPAQFTMNPVAPTGTVEDGDIVDLGDRRFRVLHLPGHTPGSIGLWDEQDGILFSGDVIYDGPLLDELPESSIPMYVETMKRLRDIPVRVVHGGHDPSFGRERMVDIIDHYIARRDNQVARGPERSNERDSAPQL